MQTTMHYDAIADALAITFGGSTGGRPITRRIAPGIQADYVGTQLVAIEILDASTRMDPQVLAKVTSATEWLTIAEAVVESRRQPTTLRNAIAGGKLEAKKHGRDWMVARSALWNYLEALGPAGRKPTDRRAPRRERRTTKASV